MANKRMFSVDVVETDAFLDLPPKTQALYFHLGTMHWTLRTRQIRSWKRM